MPQHLTYHCPISDAFSTPFQSPITRGKDPRRSLPQNTCARTVNAPNQMPGGTQWCLPQDIRYNLHQATPLHATQPLQTTRTITAFNSAVPSSSVQADGIRPNSLTSNVGCDLAHCMLQPDLTNIAPPVPEHLYEGGYRTDMGTYTYATILEPLAPAGAYAQSHQFNLGHVSYTNQGSLYAHPQAAFLDTSMPDDGSGSWEFHSPPVHYHPPLLTNVAQEYISSSAGPSLADHVLSGTTLDVAFSPPSTPPSSLGHQGMPAGGGPGVTDHYAGDLEVLTVPEEEVEFPTRGYTDNTHFYKCSWENCGQWMPGDKEQLELHLKYKHDVFLKGDPWSSTTCRWTGCGGALKKNSLLRHIEIHLGMHWRCSLCSQEYTRADSVSSHIRRNVQCGSGRPVSVPSHRAYSAQRLDGMVTLTKVLQNLVDS